VLIQDDAGDDRLLGSALSLAAGIGAILILGITAGAWLLSEYLEAGVAPLLPGLAVKMTLAMAAGCIGATLQRQLRFGLLAVAAGFSTLVGEALAIGVAVAGGGVWALLTRDVAAALVTLGILCVFMGRRPRLLWHGPSVHRLLRVGGQVLVARTAETLQQRLDRVGVGYLSGSTVLGFYTEAAILGGDSERAFSPVLAQVGLGAYARLIEQPVMLGRAFSLVQRMVVRTGTLIVVVLLVTPTELLELLYGQRWLGAAPFLRIFAFLALLYPLYEHAASVLLARDDVASVMRVRLTQLVLFIPLLAAAAWEWGAMGAAVVVDVAVMIGIGGLALAVTRHLGCPQWDDLYDYLPTFAATAATILAGRFLSLHSHTAAGLIAHILSPAVVYVLVLVVLERSRLWRDVQTVLRAVRR